MANQALKQTENIEENHNAANNNAMIKASSQNAIADKNIENSATYIKNREYILAYLQNITNNFTPFGKPHILKDRFEILINQPELRYNRSHAKAYDAKDLQNPEKSCVALVVEKYYPHQNKIIEELKAQNIANYAQLLDYGVVYMKQQNEARMVLFYEKPKGRALSELIKEQNFIPQFDIIKKLISPLTIAITKLKNMEISHGAITPKNIFIDDNNIILWDCVAQPYGYDLTDIYESFENLSIVSRPKGEATISSDIYALGILTLDACGLLENKKQYNQSQLYPAYLQKGVYNILVNEEQLEFSPLFDLLRGTLVENPIERWDIEQLNSFISGKRYNLISPSFKDTTRSFNFADTEHITLASLADAYVNNWNNALKSIADVKLVKWLDSLTTQKVKVKEQIEHIYERAAYSPTIGKSANDIIAKTIITLNPFSALRLTYKNFNIAASAIPQVLSESFKDGNLQDQINIREVISGDLIVFWRDQCDYNKHQLNWSVETIRALTRYSSIGFGLERILYELNPAMPCMSRNYEKYYSLSAKRQMLILEYLAKEKAAQQEKIYDKHLLCFLAARAGINKEMQVKNFPGYEQLKDNKELQSVLLLATIQERLKIESLPALTCWAALRIAEIIEQFHGLEVRQAISHDLQAVLPKGKLSYLIKILYNKEHINRDIEGYNRAIQLFMRGNAKIKRYKDKEKIAQKAQNDGQKFALSISFIILMAVSYGVMLKFIF